MKFAEKYRDNKELMKIFKETCVSIIANGGSCMSIGCEKCPFSSYFNIDACLSSTYNTERLKMTQQFLKEIPEIFTFDLSSLHEHASIAELILKDLEKQYVQEPDEEPEDLELVLVRDFEEDEWEELYYLGTLCEDLNHPFYTTRSKNCINAQIEQWSQMKRIPKQTIKMTEENGVYTFELITKE